MIIRVGAAGEENARRLGVALGGEHQRRGAVLGAGVHVGFAPNQFLDDPGMLLRGSPHQGGLTAIAFVDVGIGTGVQQRAHGREVAVAGGEHQRRFAGVQRLIGVGARGQKLGDDRRIPVGRARIERRRAVFIGRFGVGAGAQQELGHFHVVAGGRLQERGRADRAGQVFLGGFRQQGTHGIAIPRFRRVGQR